MESEEPPRPPQPRRRRRASSIKLLPDDFQPFSIVQETLEARPAPPTLYHYTDSAGLVGMVTNETLWLSHTRFLNDRSEMDYAKNLIATIITQSRAAAVDDRVADFLSQAEQRVPPMFEGIDLYVACFCEDGDLLSQWRGYSKGAGMFSLGFASNSLSRSGGAGQVQYSLYPVIYDPDEQLRIINEAIRKGTNRHLIQLNAATQDNLDPLTILMVAVGFCLIFFKDVSFREEREWRIVVLKQAGDHVRVRFRNHPWYPMPYTEMEFESGRLPLVDVKCGPAPEPDLATRSVEMLLRENGYPQVSTTESAIPLRW